MSMQEWAKKEIEIACARERGDNPEDEWDYGVACYKGALEAFEVLCGQGHSGYSICFTKQILNRLIDGKPLTPIEECGAGLNPEEGCKHNRLVRWILFKIQQRKERKQDEYMMSLLEQADSEQEGK